jgi:hypothetical protein
LGLRALPFVGALVLVASGARAQQGRAPVTKTRSSSPYEQASLDEVGRSLGGVTDHAPEGKIIERIEVVPLEVIEPRDPAPLFLNKIHIKSRSYIIEREVLQKVGDRYQQALVDETARNLRTLPPLSLVICVALRGTRPDRVRLVVITKDVWSLRAGWDVVATPGGPEKITIAPMENNILGLHHAAMVSTEMLPESFSLGARYAIPRVLGSRISAAADLAVIFNRKSGATEGFTSGFAVGQPLYTSYTPWSWDLAGTARKEITRRYVNARLTTFDAKSTPQDDSIPFAYNTQLYTMHATVTRSYGWGLKFNLVFGVEGDSQEFHVPPLPGRDPRAIEEFSRTSVPHSDRRFGPILIANTYVNDFATILDFETLGLQEDIHLGHNLLLKFYPVSRALGSSRDFLGVRATASYAWALGDGLASVSVESNTEAETDRITDASVAGTLLLATPRLGFGRLVLQISALDRYRNFRNATSLLGGDTNLRGYPSSFLAGQDQVVYNVEFRTRPVEVFSCQLGAAVFHDAGDAFNSTERFYLKRSAGVGLRALFPQLNRLVFRFDVAAPLVTHGLDPIPPVSFFLSFGQAFPIRP